MLLKCSSAKSVKTRARRGEGKSSYAASFLEARCSVGHYSSTYCRLYMDLFCIVLRSLAQPSLGMVPPRILLCSLSRSLNACGSVSFSLPPYPYLTVFCSHIPLSLSLTRCLSACTSLQVLHRPQQYAGFLDMDLLDISLEVTRQETKSSVIDPRTKVQQSHSKKSHLPKHP